MIRLSKLQTNIALILIFLLGIETICYYTLLKIYFPLLRISEHLVLYFWIFLENRKQEIIHKNYLYLSLFLGAISPSMAYLFNEKNVDYIQLPLISTSYLLISIFFIKEKSKIIIEFKDFTFIKVMFPYLLFPLAFYFFNAYEYLPHSAKLGSIFFVIVMIWMSLLSAFLPYSERSKFYISMAIFLLLLSIGINVFRAYIQSFRSDFILFRMFDSAFYFLLILGILNKSQKNSLFISEKF